MLQSDYIKTILVVESKILVLPFPLEYDIMTILNLIFGEYIWILKK